MNTSNARSNPNAPHNQPFNLKGDQIKRSNKKQQSKEKREKK
jgi:hypothetical protein